jgi:hypothetical protein
MNKPDVLSLGGGELVEVDYLCKLFDICRATAKKYLRVLHINTMCIGRKEYFSLPTFKRVMFVLSKPGSPGMYFPGSLGKAIAGSRKDADYITEVTDDILKQAADPTILAEMKVLEGSDPQLLRKFVTPPQGRPRKDKAE